MDPVDPRPEDPAEPPPRTDRQPAPPVQQPAPVTDQYGRPIDRVDPLDDERYERAVKDEILESEVADERFERAVKDEKLESRNRTLVILTTLALLIGAGGLYFGIAANNKAEDARDLATRSSANSVAISAEVAKQLRAKNAALSTGQREAKASANKANQSAESVKGKAAANTTRIENLRRENQTLKSEVSSLRAASQATNQRIDSIQQKLLNSGK